MATPDDLPGLGPKKNRPRLSPHLDLTRLTLSPVEGFVLSRVDGRTSYDEICHMAGLPREQTLTILRALKEGGVILNEGEKPKASPSFARSVPDPAVVEGPKGTSRANPAPRAGATPAPVLVTNEMLKQAKEKAEGVQSPGLPELPSILERLDDGTPVAEEELAEGSDLSRETKIRIVRLHRRVKQIDPHELLGITRDAEPAAIKRAFSAASKELHPDRYYGKDLGSFKGKLATIFGRITEGVQIVEKARKAKKR